MTALLQKQYADRYPFWLTPDIEAALQYLEHVMRRPFRRECHLWARRERPLIIASDGRLDKSAPASIATLIVDPDTGSRTALLASIPADLITRWGHKEQYIAHVEQAAVVIVVCCGFGQAWSTRILHLPLLLIDWCPRTPPLLDGNFGSRV